jgi:hypothetical protein
LRRRLVELGHDFLRAAEPLAFSPALRAPGVTFHYHLRGEESFMAEKSSNGQKWQLLGLGVTGFSALCTVFAALIGAGFFVGHVTAAGAKPAVTVTVTVTASPGATGTASAPVYYQGGVTINSNTLDFDSKPPGPGPITAAFYYATYSIQTASNTGGFAVWKQDGTPTASQCKSWVPTHLTTDLSNIVPGMNICFRTDQGRYGLLSVRAGTSENDLNGYVIVWGS